MRRPLLGVIMLTSLTCGCAHQAHFRPESRLPSDARIRELLARPAPREKARPGALAVERVLPTLGMAPLTVRAFVRLERDPANTDYCLALVNAAGMVAKGTCRAVEARVWTWDFENVEPGRYVIALTVSRNDGRSALRASSPPLCYSGPMFSCSDGDGANGPVPAQ